MRIPAMPFLASLDHLVLTVSDLQKTLDFYCGVLGCEEITFGDKRKAIRFGDQKINLHVKGNEIVPHALCPAPGSADLCFFKHRTDSGLGRTLQGARYCGGIGTGRAHGRNRKPFIYLCARP